MVKCKRKVIIALSSSVKITKMKMTTTKMTMKKMMEKKTIRIMMNMQIITMKK